MKLDRRWFRHPIILWRAVRYSLYVDLGERLVSRGEKLFVQRWTDSLEASVIRSRERDRVEDE